MEPSELVTGQIYFGLGYEDDAFTRPIITSYEYLGTAVESPLNTLDGAEYLFRFLGGEDRLQLKEHQVRHLILDVVELTQDLKRWAEAKVAPQPREGDGIGS